VLLLTALSGMMSAHADPAEQYSESAVKAAFLYRFMGYVEWPQELPPAGRFTIALLDGGEVADELERLLPGHPIHDRPAEARRIRSLAELGDAQALYIGPAYRGDLEQLIASVAKRPLLVVTDRDNGLDAGSTVNFLIVDRRVRFEVSLAAAETSGLSISSELLSVAARVHGGRLRSDLPCIESAPSWDLPCPERVAGTKQWAGSGVTRACRHAEVCAYEAVVRAMHADAQGRFDA
jgi:hypothetical protein